MGEIKQANFRINEDTAARFRKFCEDNGYNQAQGFDYIMSALDLTQMEQQLPGRADDIEHYLDLMLQIQTAYKHSLDLAANADERARENYKKELNLRDESIAALKERASQQEETISRLLAEAEEAKRDAEAATAKIENAKERASDAEEIAWQTRTVNEMLTSKLADAEAKLDGYDELKKSEQELLSRISSLERDLREAGKAAEQERKLAVERAVHEAEKKAEKENRKTAEQIKAGYRREIDILKEEKIRLQVQLEMISKEKEG